MHLFQFILRAVPFKYTWEGGSHLFQMPPPNRKNPTQHKKNGFTPTINRKIKKNGIPSLPGRLKWNSPNKFSSAELFYVVTYSILNWKVFS